MERASKLIRGLGISAETATLEDLVKAAWPEAVGKKIAAHTRASKLVRTRLVVEVEDREWQRQLFTLSYQIVTNMVKLLGPGAVEHLEFRVVPQRLGPRRATEAVPAAGAQDDADSIQDPLLRRIYKASRQKAQA
jgi:predicted nucleic acid-binding Zn ribbon protein